MKRFKNETTKSKVEELLQKWAVTKDSDNHLIAYFWHEEIKKSVLDITKMSAIELLEFIRDGKLTNAEAIRRSRAKLQQENIHLRGKAYAERHQNLDKMVREHLKSDEWIRNGKV